jgi:hypothetical protein
MEQLVLVVETEELGTHVNLNSDWQEKFWFERTSLMRIY